jgi:hypothetical protein
MDSGAPAHCCADSTGETHTAVPVSNMMPVKIDTHLA